MPHYLTGSEYTLYTHTVQVMEANKVKSLLGATWECPATCQNALKNEA